MWAARLKLGRLLAPAAAVLAVLAVTSCGQGGPAGRAGGPPGTSATAPHDLDLTKVGSQAAAVTIRSPRAGSTLAATGRPGGGWSITTVVSGSAQPYQSIRVSSACAAQDCSRYVVSDATGRWRIRVELPIGRVRGLVLHADYALPHAGRTATRVRVSLSYPRVTHSSTPSQQPAIPTQPSQSAPASPGPVTSRRALILVGDSLAVGIERLLPGLLPGWSVRVDARVGRPLAEGMSVLAGTELPAPGSYVLALSLFTNDDPSHTGELQQAVATTLARVGAQGCVVWATIARPPQGGVSYAGANALLERLASRDGRLRIVPWAATVSAEPSLLGPDGVHPTPQGYQVRAQLYAQAAESCR